jgi:ring-1,2-phenylacetyl-CoA epoxidase subunit PaaE
VLSGRVEMRRNFALEPDEVEQGFVLTCQAVPQTDEVAVDFDA